MDNLVKVTLRSQTIFSGFLFAFSVISWSTVIDQLRDHQGKDRLQFNCVPKQIEFKRQRCYDNYTSAMSPLLTPLDFAGITFGVSGCGWLFVTLMGVEMLRRIHKETNRRRQKTLKKQFLGVFIGHIFLQFVLLVAMIVLFLRYQKLKYPAEYSCFSANTTLTSFNREAITITCNDLRYKEKSKLNVAIIVVFSVSILFCLLTIIQLAISKDELSELLLGNIEEDHNEEEKRPLQDRGEASSAGGPVEPGVAGPSGLNMTHHDQDVEKARSAGGTVRPDVAAGPSVLIIKPTHHDQGKSRDEQGASSDSPGTGTETSGSVRHDTGIDPCLFMCD